MYAAEKDPNPWEVLWVFKTSKMKSGTSQGRKLSAWSLPSSWMNLQFILYLICVQRHVQIHPSCLRFVHQSIKPGTLPGRRVVANDVDVQGCNLLIHQTKRMCTASLPATNHEIPHLCMAMHGHTNLRKPFHLKSIPSNLNLRSNHSRLRRHGQEVN